MRNEHPHSPEQFTKYFRKGKPYSIKQGLYHAGITASLFLGLESIKAE